MVEFVKKSPLPIFVSWFHGFMVIFHCVVFFHISFGFAWNHILFTNQSVQQKHIQEAQLQGWFRRETPQGRDQLFPQQPTDPCQSHGSRNGSVLSNKNMYRLDVPSFIMLGFPMRLVNC